MRLVFRADGSLMEFHYATPPEPAPGSPLTVIDVEYPGYFVNGVARAARAGRVTYESGHVCLDGTPYVPPTIRTPVSYGMALSAIGSATTVPQLREILYRVCDALLSQGAIDL